MNDDKYHFEWKPAKTVNPKVKFVHDLDKIHEEDLCSQVQIEQVVAKVEGCSSSDSSIDASESLEQILEIAQPERNDAVRLPDRRITR